MYPAAPVQISQNPQLASFDQERLEYKPKIEAQFCGILISLAHFIESCYELHYGHLTFGLACAFGIKSEKVIIRNGLVFLAAILESIFFYKTTFSKSFYSFRFQLFLIQYFSQEHRLRYYFCYFHSK